MADQAFCLANRLAIEHMFDMMECPNERGETALPHEWSQVLGVEGLFETGLVADIAAPLPRLDSSEGGLLRLQPGQVTELTGMPGTGLTRLGLKLLAEHSRSAPVVAVDTRGWVSPEAAWEAGVVPDRLVIVRCDDLNLWPKVVAALLEGIRAMYAEVPDRIRERDLRRLAALARARKAAVAMRSTNNGLPSGISHLKLRGLGVTWEGADRGHGKLMKRRLVLEASGKGVAGMNRRFEVEDEGKDSLRVVSDVVVDQAGRAVG